MRADFRSWLVLQGTGDRVISDLLSRVSRVEAACGSLDTAIANGSIEHLKRGMASRIHIDGDVASGIATLKSAVNKYVSFVESN